MQEIVAGEIEMKVGKNSADVLCVCECDREQRTANRSHACVMAHRSKLMMQL